MSDRSPGTKDLIFDAPILQSEEISLIVIG
jgi:hypothetical protein